MSRLRLAPQIVLLVLPALWVASRYHRTGYFYDEWSLIQAVTTSSGLKASFLNFNGHLWLFPSLVYRAQVSWFGLGNHAFVWTVFILSLSLLAVAIRWLLVELTVPAWVATCAAVVITYFGIAAQNVSFEIQLAANFAYAFGFLGTAVGLRWRNPRGAALASALLLLTNGFDSSGALLVLAFAVPVLIAAWRTWSLPLLLVPAVLAAVLWYELADRGPSFPASTSVSLHFARSVVLTSAGGLLGGGETAGVVLLVLGLLALASAAWRRRASLVVFAGVLGALTAATLTTVALALTRSGVAAGHLNDFNRYLQQVAFFVLLAVLPPLCAVLPRRARPALALGLAVVFFLNLRPLTTYRNAFESFTQQTHAGVAEAQRQLDLPCQPGLVHLPETAPLGALGPQITVKLLENLMRRGALPRLHDRAPTAPVVTCTPRP